jgi:mannosyltransferase
MNRRHSAAAVAALTILAALLRVPGLNSGFWFDELNTVVYSVRPPLVQVATAFPGDYTHPFYGVMAQGAVALFGEHPWSVRLPAVLFGIATIPVIYLLTSAVSTQLEGLLAALLLAVSYHHVWFSQNARGYTVLSFVVVLSTLLCVSLLKRPRSGPAIAYAVAMALGTYTHLTMAFTAVAQACVWTAVIAQTPRGPERDAQIRTALLALGGAAALSLILYLPMAGQVREFFSGTHQRTAGVATPTWAIVELLRGLRIGFGTLGPLALAVLGAIGALSYLLRDRLAFALFVLPGVISAAVIVVIGAAMRPRFFFPLLGFALMFVVRGALQATQLATGPARAGAARLAGAAIVFAIAIVSALSLRHNYQYPKQDFEGALRYVESHRQADEAVVTAGAAMFPYSSYYQTAWTPIEESAPVESLLAHQGRTWVVYSFPEYMDPKLGVFLRDRCGERQVFRGTVGGGDVVVCTTGGHPGRP